MTSNPEGGGRDYDHLWSEHQHAVREIERLRRRVKAQEQTIDELYITIGKLTRAEA